MAECVPSLTAEGQRRYVEALETLPPLTRLVFLLSCRDGFPYAEIAWRCGTSELDVRVRVADALNRIHQYLNGQRKLAGSVRRELLPVPITWAEARAREGDRRLAPWLSPEKAPDRRGALDWMALAFECAAR